MKFKRTKIQEAIISDPMIRSQNKYINLLALCFPRSPLESEPRDRELASVYCKTKDEESCLQRVFRETSGQWGRSCPERRKYYVFWNTFDVLHLF